MEFGAFVKEVEFNIAGEDYFFKYESETLNKKRDISIKNSEGELLYHVHTDPKKGYETYELGDKMNEKLWDNITYGLSDKNIVVPKTFNRVERLPIFFNGLLLMIEVSTFYLLFIILNYCFEKIYLKKLNDKINTLYNKIKLESKKKRK